MSWASGGAGPEDGRLFCVSSLLSRAPSFAFWQDICLGRAVWWQASVKRFHALRVRLCDIFSPCAPLPIGVPAPISCCWTF